MTLENRENLPPLVLNAKQTKSVVEGEEGFLIFFHRNALSRLLS